MTPQEYIKQIQNQHTFFTLPKKLPKDMYVREAPINNPQEEATTHLQLWLPKQKQPTIELKYVLKPGEEENFGTKVTKKFHHYRKKGILHATTTPAFTITNQEQRWYHKGHLHNETGPALVNETKTLHRYQPENFPQGFNTSTNFFLNPTIPLTERIAYTKTLIKEDPTFLNVQNSLDLFPQNLSILDDTFHALLHEALTPNPKLIPLPERILTTTQHLQKELYQLAEQTFKTNCDHIPADKLSLMLTTWVKKEMK